MAYKHHPKALWNQARHDYIHGLSTLKDLSKTTGIPYSSLISRSKHQHWGKLRDRFMANDQAKLEASLETPTPIEAPPSTFESDLLSKVRTRCLETEALMGSELDPVRRRALAGCLTDLAELERRLANRPLIGSLKPTRSKRNHNVMSNMPLDLEPEPTVPTPPTTPPDRGE